MRLSPLAFAAGLALLAAPAFAQSAATVELDESVVVQPWNTSVDAVEDLDVMGPGGSKIGEVEAVRGSNAQTASALAVDFEDDNTYGGDERLIPLDQFTYQNNQLTLSANPASVAQFPVYED